ncbi:hypothetical protein [Granulicella tundricola]|uniref:hypothetical protein n=1 Tax=Granulicella tundricola TaxID=940615 RepID=UPI0018DC796B|nr:hypothetical protein [Granulicella tundricola]
MGLAIVVQPKNQSVPMGLSGSFTVQADDSLGGAGLHYQWSRNGTLIAGATSSSYTTAATAFSDSGSTFTVLVSDASGSVASNAASLTVTARAPKAGDLRFQQVDAASTVNGYVFDDGLLHDVACPLQGGGGTTVTGKSATGTAFYLANDHCSYQFDTFDLPAGTTGLSVGYADVGLPDYQSVLDGTLLPPNSPAPNDPGSVINSLNLDPVNNTVALSFINSDNSSGFDRATYTLPASGLQAAATQEGLKGRVVTAISYDGSQATFLSYGWKGDPSTVYEAKAMLATLSTALTAAQELASEGYIITATANSQAADSGVILLGTRVQGDTMARPILVGDAEAGTQYAVFSGGYAVVAVVYQYLQNNGVLWNYIGER